jgi:predicted nuclease of predicted toxin-antitoxin system
MYIYDEEGLLLKIRESSTIAPETVFHTRSSAHVLWVYISGDARSDSELKNTAFAVAKTVMQKDSDFTVTTVSFLLPGKLVDIGRGRDISIHREQLLELQNDEAVQALAFKPDVKILEEEIKRCEVIPDSAEFVIQLYFRFKAEVSIYANQSNRYTDSEMRACAFNICDIIFGKDNEIKEVKIAFRGHSKFIAIDRENFEGNLNDDRDAVLKSLEIVTFAAPHMH